MKKYAGRFCVGGFVALAMLCASIDGARASTGGVELDYKKYPYVASMNVKDGFWNKVREYLFIDKVHRCMGAVISPTVMITAAHCIMDDDLTGTFMSPAIRMKIYSNIKNEVKMSVPSDAKKNPKVKGGGQGYNGFLVEWI